MVEAPSITASLGRLYGYLSHRRRWQLAGIGMLMLVGGAAEMATLGAVVPVLALLADPDAARAAPFLQGLMRATGVDSAGLLRLTVGIFVVVALLAAFVRMLLFWSSYRFTFGLGGDIGREVYRRTLHRSYSWHVARNSSEILAAIEKVNSVTNSIIVQLMQGSVALVVALGILVSLLLIDARTAIVAGAAFMTLYVATTVITRRRLRGNAVQAAANRTARIRAVQEGLGGIRDVLLDGAQPIYVRRFSEVDGAMRRAQASNAFIGASPRVVMETAGVLLILLLAFVLSSRAGGLAPVLPALGALALGAQKLLPQMQQVYTAWTSVQGNRGELDDVLALLEAPLAPEYAADTGDEEVAAAPRAQAPLIAMRALAFRYHPDTPDVLRGIDLDIARGERIGFVGATGSGKSTLIDLVLGLLTPTGGAIEVEGDPLTRRSVRGWQRRIAHVPQAIHLIDASIAENVAFGVARDAIDRRRMEEAAFAAQLDGFVAGLEHGYDTSVGERGVRLSGGQRQRIGLARALYRDADVLVLDEATSALDNRTERQVMAALDTLHRGKTILMIAHRLSTVRNCDRIVVVEHGRIAACGSWDELVATSRAFAAMVAGRAHDDGLDESAEPSTREPAEPRETLMANKGAE